MPRDAEAGREGRVGCLLVGGCGTTVFGAILTYMMLAGGVHRMTFTRGPDGRGGDPGVAVFAGLGLLILFAGLVAIGFGLAYGIWHDRNRFAGKAVLIDGARVLSRFAHDATGANVLLEYAPDDMTLRYYVLLEIAPGIKKEFECDRLTFFTCGEGLVGVATVQGKWLGQFKHDVRSVAR